MKMTINEIIQTARKITEQAPNLIVDRDLWIKQCQPFPSTDESKLQEVSVAFSKKEASRGIVSVLPNLMKFVVEKSGQVITTRELNEDAKLESYGGNFKCYVKNYGNHSEIRPTSQ